ncbi:MAG TPA: aldehyde dehydrogenase family protein, partial [Stellaceae bacterium]|nr:aldehyde dehydrogenase family protein [Stellaceae bacterium]
MAQFKNYVAGEWIESPQVNKNLNPADLSDVIGEYARADRALVERAIDAATAAFPKWSMSGVQERADILDRIGTEIIARKDELGKLLTREEGKTIAEATGEAARAGAIFKFFAGEVLRYGGEKLPSVRPGVEVEMTREPVGVIGLITPWNFPIAIPAWKIAPALAYGNCVVFKPADLVPGCAWALTEIISRSGLPAGVFNLVMGPGSVVGDTIAKSPLVHGVSFTGSVSVGANVRDLVATR